MELLDLIVKESLNKYFNILSNIGYINNEDINSILTIVCLQLFLDKFSEFITNEDLKDVLNIILCISDSCLIPLPEYFTEDSLFKLFESDKYTRITEKELVRLTENGTFRIKE